MKRACFGLRLYPGTETEYDRRHAEIRPELKTAIREAGIRNLSAFRRGTDVWHYAECDPDGATAFAKLGATNVNAKWGESLRPIVAADGERMWFGEIFHANGGGVGPFERGLFTLVVHPERVRAAVRALELRRPWLSHLLHLLPARDGRDQGRGR